MSAEMEMMNSSSEKIYLTRTPIARVHRYKERKILKVIGASWLQTKITLYFLVAICVFGIVAIVFAEIGSYNLFVEDGNYAATVFWKSKTGFRIEFWGQGNDLNEIAKGCGRAYYRPDMPNTGWSVIEIETNEEYPDWTQAFAAGLLEGSLTWQAIYWQHENTIQPFCEQNKDRCEDVRALLRENSEEIREKAKRLGESDPFWHQIDMFYIQLDGVETGWNYAVKRSRQSVEMDPIDFLWLNTMSMMNDLESDKGIERTSSKNGSTAFISFLQSDTEGQEIYVAHNSAGRYNLMLRLIKRYKFHYHSTQNDTAVVPGTVVTFTSYPGSLTSQDEFYTVTSDGETVVHNLIVAGSATVAPKNYFLDSFDATNDTLLAPRAMAANRLASGGESWVKIIGRSSDPENMQWAVVDLTKLNGDSSESSGGRSGLLWIAGQSSGESNASDQTATLVRNGYWTNMNVPDHHYIEDVIRTHPVHDDQDFKYSNRNIPSEVNIFETHPRNSTTLDNITHLMRNVSSTSVFVREDVSSENPQPYGVIDTKVVKGSNHEIVDFVAISGPPFTNQVPDELSNTATSSVPLDAPQHSLPFQWSTSAFNSINHLGHPDVWNFKSVRPKWIWI